MCLTNDIVYKNLDDDMCGRFDHRTGKIYIDPRLSPAARRSTLVHERIHKNLDHKPIGGPAHTAREIMVEQLAARRLISWAMLVSVAGKCDTVAELAEIWHVDIGLAFARMTSMTKLEQALFEVCGRYCVPEAN